MSMIIQMVNLCVANFIIPHLSLGSLCIRFNLSPLLLSLPLTYVIPSALCALGLKSRRVVINQKTHIRFFQWTRFAFEAVRFFLPNKQNQHFKIDICPSQLTHLFPLLGLQGIHSIIHLSLEQIIFGIVFSERPIISRW